jgi:hypothetical protein
MWEQQLGTLLHRVKPTVAISILSTGTCCCLGAHIFVTGGACRVSPDAMLSCDDVAHDRRARVMMCHRWWRARRH